MNFVFLGPPGAGKGSLAVLAAAEYGIPHVSTGDIFRSAVKNKTPLGVKVKSIMDSGALVSDEITTDLVRERLCEADAKRGYILDGFPRTVEQAKMFDSFAENIKVVNFMIQTEQVVKRLETRRVCRSCGANFNVLSKPPKKEGVCDECGGELYQREDDKPLSIKKRLEVYLEQTQPLIDFYSEKGVLSDVDAGIETAELLKVFMRIFPKG